MNNVADYIFTSMHTYTLMVCTDDITACMYPSMLLVLYSLVCHWLDVCIDVMFVCGYHIDTNVLMSICSSIFLILLSGFVRRQKLKCFGHLKRSEDLGKIILEG